MAVRGISERAKNYYHLASIKEDQAMRDWKSDPVNWYEMNPDYASRLVVMSALLYYRFASPVLTDDDNDKLIAYLSEPECYAKLTPLRQWQLGDINEFSASTFRVFVTTMAYHGALSWHEKHKGIRLTYPEPDWKFSKEHATHYIVASDPITGEK